MILDILPKQNWDSRLPPKCPLDSIQFIQLKPFKGTEPLCDMGAGYDLIEMGYRERKQRLQQEKLE